MPDTNERETGMIHASPLPNHLTDRYRSWKRHNFNNRSHYYETLAAEGQHPREMIISCCDSRVHVTQMFQADSGEMFIHRNVAALVPPYEADNEHHGTSAAVEYAVRVLKVERLIVLGHSNCGGVEGCYDMCEGSAPDLLDQESFIGRWIDLLRPGYERLPEHGSRAERLTLLEKEGVLVSLENLMTFPWLAQAVEDESLSVIGLWTDIAAGSLEWWSPREKAFVAI